MANRWSLKEDYIVCKFSYENAWKCISTEGIHGLMLELKKAGFNTRSKLAVNKRVRDYQCLFCGDKAPYAVNQVRSIYQSFSARVNNLDLTKSIKSYIAEVYDPNVITDDTTSTMVDLYSKHDGLIHSKRAIDYSSTFPMVLQKFIDQKGFKKHKEIYNKIYMKQDTFSSILRGKYSVVKKENVLRLCVGLHLSVDEAEELMESAGYLFSKSIMTDVVIKAFLLHHCYDTFAIDDELCENEAPALFGAA